MKTCHTISRVPTAVTITCMVLSCAPEAIQNNPSDAIEGPTSSTLAQWSKCRSTQGVWHEGLQSCFCQPGHLFSAHRGCFPVEDSVTGMREPAAQIKPLGHLLVSFPSIQKAPEANAGRPPCGLECALRGATVEGVGGPGPEVLLTLEPLGRRQIDHELRQARQGPANGLVAYYAPPPQSIDSGRTCVDMVNELQGPRRADAGKMCESLRVFLEVLRADDLPQKLLHAKSIGSGGGAVDLLVANLPAAMGHGTYRIVGKSKMPIARAAQFNVGNDLRLDVILSPRGQVMGGRIHSNHAAPSSRPFLLQRSVVYFDSDYQAIEVIEDEYGDRLEARQGAARWLRDLQQANVRRLLTDGRLPPAYGSVRAMLLEDAIDLRAADLLTRVAPRVSSLSAFVETGNLALPLFAPDAADTRPVLDVLVSDGERGGQHGTMVASLLAADLPNAALTWMPTGNGSWTGNSELASQALIDKINEDRPRVVNISKGFDDDLADCEALFGRVFATFEHSVLFVVAAGNYGMRGATDVCPASLASRYPNALSVAGVDGTGRLHPNTNYGPGVHVAAPYCARVLSLSSGKPEGVEECGTSFAAPVVANAALRLFAGHPAMLPVDAKRLILASCSNDRLDVECGGQFRQELLDAKH